MGKVWPILGGVLGFLTIAIIDFTPLLLFDLLFTCRLKDYHFFVFQLCF